MNFGARASAWSRPSNWASPPDVPKLTLNEGIPDGTAEVCQRRKNDTLALCIGRHVIRRNGGNRTRPEKLKQIGGADAGGNPFDHDQSDAAIASEQNNCGDRYPTSFFGVQETPSTDHFLLRIAQNWKRQFVLASYPIRLLRGIHGQRGNVNTEAAEVIGKVTEFRQLAETKRSPVAAIEDEQKCAIAQQGRKDAGRPRGIGKSKILGKRTDLRILNLVQAHPAHESERQSTASPSRPRCGLHPP